MRIISGKAKGTKLNTLEGDSTRPTLDRVKESLFNIIQASIQDAVVLDLFGGSGALGIESLSRGASLAVICDNSKYAISIINENLEKAKLEERAMVFNLDYQNCLAQIKDKNIKFDLIFIDPPYKSGLASLAIEQIMKLELLNETGTIILETNLKQKDLNKINESYDLEVYDVRKYGKILLMFLSRKG